MHLLFQTASHVHIGLSGHFFSQIGFEENGKNKKSKIFLLGLKYTLRTCF